MVDYKSWEKRFSNRVGAQFENEDKVKITSDIHEYTYTFLRGEGEELINKAKSVGLNIEKAYFEKQDVKTLNEQVSRMYRYIFVFSDHTGMEITMILDAEFFFKDRSLFFYISPGIPVSHIKNKKEYDSIKKIVKYYIDYILSKDEIRILSVVGNLRKIKSPTLENLLNK